MLLDDATVAKTFDTSEDFTWVFDYVKTNAEQLRAIITTWLDNDCAESAEQMNEIVMREYKKLFN